jgi:hypothetical protein
MRPELGVIPVSLRDKYLALIQQQQLSHADQQELDNLKLKLNKILNSKTSQIIFLGFKGLFNQLFINTSKKVQRLWETDIPNVEKIYSGLRSGQLIFNQNTIDLFFSGRRIIIVDEVHEAYSKQLNNYGLSLQLLLDMAENPEDYKDIIEVPKKNTPCLFLSATPLYSSDVEIVDLINLIVPRSQLPNKKFIKYDYIYDDKGKLKPDALKKIKQLMFGHVSYFVDISTDYPSYSFDGAVIEGVDFLRFERCEMSEIHYNVYKELNFETLNLGEISLMDGVIPYTKNQYLYSTKEIFRVLMADSATFQQLGIGLSKTNVISGPFLQYDNIKKYFAKYGRLIELLRDNLINKHGKAIIIHQFVKYFGILFIQQLLLQNGFIDDDHYETDSTLCVICGKTKKEHTDDNHYKPARFLVIHGDMPNQKIDQVLIQFRTQNTNGESYRFLLGSQILNQSKNTNNVRQVYILSPPSSISELIQIIGRAVRKLSHKDLPLDQRHVSIRILVTSIPGLKKYSIEEEKYIEKYRVYSNIIEINKILNECAIDNALFYDLYQSTEQSLTVEMFNKAKLNLRLVDDVYNIYYGQDEIDFISFIVKYLFINVSHVWKIKDLWNAVRDPPFYMAINTKLLSYGNFLIVLDRLMDTTYIENNFILTVNNMSCKLTQVESFLILYPINQSQLSEYNALSIESIVHYNPWCFTNTYISTVANITELFPTKQISDLEVMETSFIEKYKDMDLFLIPTSLNEFTLDFHVYFIEKLIVYFIDFYLGRHKLPTLEMHLIYLKFLYFYDLYNLILFADNMMNNNDIVTIWGQYVYNDDTFYDEYRKLNPLLFSSYKYTNSGSLMDKISKYQSPHENKALDSILPIGYFFNKHQSHIMHPTVYNVETNSWVEIFSYTYTGIPNEIENNLLVGYWEITPNNFELKFKIRKSIIISKKVPVSDMRFVEKGAICVTKSRAALQTIFKQLDLVYSDKKVKTSCQILLQELLRRETEALKDWKKKGIQKIKWFYLPFEKQPDWS